MDCLFQRKTKEETIELTHKDDEEKKKDSSNNVCVCFSWMIIIRFNKQNEAVQGILNQ